MVHGPDWSGSGAARRCKYLAALPRELGRGNAGADARADRLASIVGAASRGIRVGADSLDRLRGDDDHSLRHGVAAHPHHVDNNTGGCGRGSLRARHHAHRGAATARAESVSQMPHPRRQWDDAFQTPIRFSLMAALGGHTEIDFPTMRDLLEADGSVLSKAVSHLEQAGYVKVTKGYAGTRPRTWIESTPIGAQAFQQHLLALRAIAANHPAPTPTPSPTPRAEMRSQK